jgi:hypothetical protein
MNTQTTRRALRLAALRLRERWASYRRRIPADRGGKSTKTDTSVQAVWNDERHLIAGYAERVACLLNPDVTASWNVLARLTGQRRAQMMGRGGPLVTKAGTRRKWFKSHKLQPIPSPPESEIPEHLSTVQLELDTVIRRKRWGFWHTAWWGDDPALSYEQVALLGLSGAVSKVVPMQTRRERPHERPEPYRVAFGIRENKLVAPEANTIKLSMIRPFGREKTASLIRNSDDGFFTWFFRSLQGGMVFVEFSNLIFGLADDMAAAMRSDQMPEPDIRPMPREAVDARRRGEDTCTESSRSPAEFGQYGEEALVAHIEDEFSWMTHGEAAHSGADVIDLDKLLETDDVC